MLLVTFSGLDASGKSTHVALTAEYLGQRGYCVYVLETAHLSAGGLLLLVRNTVQLLTRKVRRTRRSQPLLRGETARHTAGATTRSRRGQWAACVARFIVYPLDCVALFLGLCVLSVLGYTAIICDRYVYDKMVNIASPTGRLGRLMRRLSRKPDLAVLLAATPVAVRRRREEYGERDYAVRYAGYRQLIIEGWELTPLPSVTIEETQHRVEQALDDLLFRHVTATSRNTLYSDVRGGSGDSLRGTGRVPTLGRRCPIR